MKTPPSGLINIRTAPISWGSHLSAFGALQRLQKGLHAAALSEELGSLQVTSPPLLPPKCSASLLQSAVLSEPGDSAVPWDSSPL